MEWHDALYGSWHLPEVVERLVLTDRAIRMHDITQSVMPNPFLPYGPIPSRFAHGLGVCRLAVEVLAEHPELTDRYGDLLPVAAFLHDAGSPPFSHLTEPFLRKDHGHDGESFLTTMLSGSETEQALREQGISVAQVVALVTGQDMPVAEVLNGSLDIDNIDNVARYHEGALFEPLGYDPLQCVSAYVFDTSEQRWYLKDEAIPVVDAWKRARARVYGLISEYSAMFMMLQRALYLEWLTEGLSEQFYTLSDMQAVAYLMASPLPDVRNLLSLVASHHWYVQVYALQAEQDAPELLKQLAQDPLSRHALADQIAAEFDMPRSMVCASLSVGRDRRKVTLPLVSRSVYSQDGDHPIYRAMVWVHPRYEHHAQAIAEVVQRTIFAK